MRRFVFPLCLAALCGVCLLAVGRADGPPAGFNRFVDSWMSVVGVIGADGAEEDDAGAEFEPEATYEIAMAEDDDERERPRGDRQREHRHRDGHGSHRGPPHHGPGPGRGGPPGGPDMHRAALRGFHEIIRRLARIEEHLGIDDPLPAGPRGDRPRRPHPEMGSRRGPEGSAERPLDRLDIPEDVRRMMEERMQEGRRRMEQAKQRMEEARKKFREMEQRIAQLEAEVERLKAGK